MSFIRSLFGRKDLSPNIQHPIFGSLRYASKETWENEAFEFWRETIDLTITAAADGPTALQVNKFVLFRDSEQTLWPRCLEALDIVRRDFQVAAGQFKITGLSIPSFGAGRAGHLWSLWVELDTDDHFSYGVQSENDWQTIVAFADD